MEADASCGSLCLLAVTAIPIKNLDLKVYLKLNKKQKLVYIIWKVTSDFGYKKEKSSQHFVDVSWVMGYAFN